MRRWFILKFDEKRFAKELRETEFFDLAQRRDICGSATGSAAVITGDGLDDASVDGPRKTKILLAELKRRGENPGRCLFQIVGNGQALDPRVTHRLVDQYATADERFAALLDLAEHPGGVVVL